MRAVTIAICFSMMVAACGGGRGALADYADQVEAMVTTMNRDLDALDAGIAGGLPTLQEAREYFARRLAARRTLVTGLDALEPPEEVAELHGIALDALSRLTDAEQALADRVDTMDTNVGLVSLWNTPEGLAARAVDEKVVAVCRAAEEQLGATDDGSSFGDMPWIPSELQETVQVFFGCTQGARGVGP